ncbi:uncharacterized protein yc1106_00551 [Curvularia clavata]|uniref:VOC domain-containing protein n=1 Tax=Curvularia clavata TaxID=95742 RepID=A0A9Q8Z091_CURCL|nr:uncharacterized protein yc1106_00551 [Curvularia clavata]
MASNNANFPPGPYESGVHFAPPPRPSSPSTAGYSLNHFMMRIKDPKKSLEFYCDCLGMHVVFIFNVGPWTIYYLGSRDVNMSNIRQSKGLLELYHIPADSSLPYASGNDYSAPGVGFGHIGFTVPDVAEATKRVEGFGFEVIKPLGEAKEEQMAVPDEIVQGKYEPVVEGYKHIFKQLTFVKDPDGYWVELLPPNFKLLGLTVATQLGRNLAKENNMPDGKGWRLGHNKHYKKQNKTSAPPKPDGDGSAAPGDAGDKRHQTSWLKTAQGSRPPTPTNTLTTATALEDIEDARSERSDTPALPRDSKPKLARYASLFATFKETSKGPEFLEPWGEEAPPRFQPYIDPLQVIQSVRSHIVKCSTPVPLEHNSGLLRLFEDYRKIREQKEGLEKLLEETLEDWTQAQGQWTHSEDRYTAEIRRLELLIAHGTSGMEGLVQARQGSVLGRQRRYRKTKSHDKSSHEHKQVPAEKLDAEIKLLSQKGKP